MNCLNHSSEEGKARTGAGIGARIKAETRAWPEVGLQDRARKVLPK